MTVLANLPTFKWEIAFSPTNIFSTTQTWTDITPYVRDEGNRSGRQHMLDRFEAGVLSLTVNNRTGFFTTTNSIRTRLPIRVTATYSAVNYTCFYGLIDDVDPRLSDELNADLHITASDYLKLLSLTYMDKSSDPANPLTTGYYSSFVNTGSGLAKSWYRMDGVVGNVLIDTLGGANGTAQGNVSSAEGVLLYDVSVAADLTNGTGNASGVLNLTQAITTTPSVMFVDFWFVGENCANTTLLPAVATFGGNNDASFSFDGNGFLTSAYFGTITNTVRCNDGKWHHVGIGSDISSGVTSYVVLDGVSYNLSSTVELFPYDSASQLVIGSTYTGGSSPSANGGPSAPVYIDEVVCSATASAGIVAEVQARYHAGIRLRRNLNSGDMANDVLQVAGFGSFPYDVNYASYSAPAGDCVVAGFTSPVTGNTALDLLLLCCDTETGGFLAATDGTLNFLTRSYPYTQHSAKATFTNYDNGYSNPLFYKFSDLSLPQDDMDLWTSVAITPNNGSTQRWQAASATQALYGTSTLTKSTQPTTLADASGQAQFLGALYSAPLRRMQTVTVGAETNSATQIPLMLSLKLGDLVSFVYRDPYGTVTQTSAIIEAIDAHFDAEPGQYAVSYTLDPYPVSQGPFLIMDDATYGKLDTDLLA